MRKTSRAHRPRAATWGTVRARLTTPPVLPAQTPTERDHAGVAEWLAEHGEAADREARRVALLRTAAPDRREVVDVAMWLARHGERE